jgi:hypothetical protein
MLKSSSLCLNSSNLDTFWLKIQQFWPFEEISNFSNGGHLGWRAWLSDIILKGTDPGTIPARFGSKSHYPFWSYFPFFIKCPSTFHILIFSKFSSETTVPIATKLWCNGPWMAPFQKYVRWSRLLTKMAAKLKIEKRGDEIWIVYCCFSISQNELKF